MSIINMACVAHGYKMEKDKQLENAFERLANALDAIQSHLTFNVVFALRDTRDAVVHSGADGVRAHGEHLLQEIDVCPLKTAEVTDAANHLRELLFS